LPRFVVLEHDGPEGRHWDLMLQSGEALATWALASAPGSPEPVPARALPDHRLAYLDYEGPIAGGRGLVVRWDEGTYQLERQGPAQWVVLLSGRRLVGQAVLQRTGPDPTQWTLFFRASAPPTAR
jgi:hypothetical protein